jgi:hypothetical protein
MPSKKPEKEYDLASPPAHPVIWRIWVRGKPKRFVLREARTFFVARASACVELGTDPQALEGAVEDERAPEQREAERLKKKARRKRPRSTSSKRRSKS